MEGHAMNERIRELARTSHLDVYGLGKDRAKWEHTLEKFAELIVAEMLQTCEDHPGWSGRMIGEQIKEHFGVEE
jgi:hypothetical protein